MDLITAYRRRCLTVLLLRKQMEFAAKHGILVAYSKKDPALAGADWDDPTKFAPPEVDPTSY